MTDETSLNSDKAIAYRVAQDLVKRSASGPYVYILFWPLVAIASDFHLAYPKTFVAVTLAMFLLSAWRIIHAGLLVHRYPERFDWWFKIFQVSALPHALLWSLMFAFSMLIDNRLFAVFMSFSSAGLIAGGANSFSPSRFMSYAYVAVFLVPVIIVSMIVPGLVVLSLLLLGFLFFIIFLSRSQQKEYWRSLNNELLLAKQSRTDALTQLDNRRFFDEKLNEFCHLSSRNHDELSVLVIDCDHFKNINDSFGHDTGDECLRHLAMLLNKALTRTTDVCARYGGEEFSVILAGAEIEGAKIVCERIRQLIESTPLVVGNEVIAMTVSIGCVSRKLARFFPGLPTELFKQADSALYRAKQAGRNCCVYSYYDEATDSYRFDPES